MSRETQEQFLLGVRTILMVLTMVVTILWMVGGTSVEVAIIVVGLTLGVADFLNGIPTNNNNESNR